MNFFKKNLTERAGFTLVELLVGLAVLGILIALTFGGIPSLLESAERAKCRGNLRALASAGALYANDNNGEYPPNNSSSWSHHLKPYIGKNKETFRCPSTSFSMGYNYRGAIYPTKFSPINNLNLSPDDALFFDRYFSNHNSISDPKGVNVAYADGRVEWVGSDDFAKSYTDHSAKGVLAWHHWKGNADFFTRPVISESNN